MNSVGEREAAIVHMAESEEAIAALRQHVQEIVDGAAFKGSNRSAQFLTYIVERAIAGNFESLKERVIGMELFGRPADYETSEDAIVRVTASDVRKRLLQHYGRNGAASDFRISLPLGSYIPEITRSSDSAPSHRNGNSVPRGPEPIPVDSPAAQQSGATVPREATPIAFPDRPLPADLALMAKGLNSPTHNGKRWLIVVAGLVALNLAMWAVAWRYFSSRAKVPPIAETPWSAFFASPHATHLISSDPDIEGIQILTGAPTSISDYANHKYVPEPNSLSPAIETICKDLLHGDKTSTVDAQVAADISEMARGYGKKIDVVGARDLQFSNLKTDDNFIFLGSPLSNPWSAIFNDQLDFQFVPDTTRDGKFSGAEIVRNFHPRPGEPGFYLPTAKGGGTGESFAMIALVGNPDQSGQVLLLAGADREGTLAAGRLVTDLPRFSAAMRTCGISTPGPLRHFELLLRVHTMASYPTQSVVATCHLLPGPVAR